MSFLVPDRKTYFECSLCTKSQLHPTATCTECYAFFCGDCENASKTTKCPDVRGSYHSIAKWGRGGDLKLCSRCAVAEEDSTRHLTECSTCRGLFCWMCWDDTVGNLCWFNTCHTDAQQRSLCGKCENPSKTEIEACKRCEVLFCSECAVLPRLQNKCLYGAQHIFHDYSGPSPCTSSCATSPSPTPVGGKIGRGGGKSREERKRAMDRNSSFEEMNEVMSENLAPYGSPMACDYCGFMNRIIDLYLCITCRVKSCSGCQGAVVCENGGRHKFVNLDAVMSSNASELTSSSNFSSSHSFSNSVGLSSCMDISEIEEFDTSLSLSPSRSKQALLPYLSSDHDICLPAGASSQTWKLGQDGLDAKKSSSSSLPNNSGTGSSGVIIFPRDSTPTLPDSLSLSLSLSLSFSLSLSLRSS